MMSTEDFYHKSQKLTRSLKFFDGSLYEICLPISGVTSDWYAFDCCGFVDVFIICLDGYNCTVNFPV